MMSAEKAVLDKIFADRDAVRQDLAKNTSAKIHSLESNELCFEGLKDRLIEPIMDFYKDYLTEKGYFSEVERRRAASMFRSDETISLLVCQSHAQLLRKGIYQYFVVSLPNSCSTMLFTHIFWQNHESRSQSAGAENLVDATKSLFDTKLRAFITEIIK